MTQTNGHTDRQADSFSAEKTENLLASIVTTVLKIF